MYKSAQNQTSDMHIFITRSDSAVWKFRTAVAAFLLCSKWPILLLKTTSQSRLCVKSLKIEPQTCASSYPSQSCSSEISNCNSDLSLVFQMTHLLHVKCCSLSTKFRKIEPQTWHHHNCIKILQFGNFELQQ